MAGSVVVIVGFLVVIAIRVHWSLSLYEKLIPARWPATPDRVAPDRIARNIHCDRNRCRGAQPHRIADCCDMVGWMSTDPHKPLRDDVRLLGELLGSVLRTHEGDALFQQVERVRALAKRARAGSDADFETLARELSQLPVESALPLARAFAHFLNLSLIHI